MSSFRVELSLSGLNFVTSLNTNHHTQNKWKNNCIGLVTFVLQIVCKISAKLHLSRSFYAIQRIHTHTHVGFDKHNKINVQIAFAIRNTHFHSMNVLIWRAQKMQLFNGAKEKFKLRNQAQSVFDHVCAVNIWLKSMGVNPTLGVTYIIVVHKISMYNGVHVYLLFGVFIVVSAARSL